MKRLMWSLTMVGGLFFGVSAVAQTLELVGTVTVPGLPTAVSVMGDYAYISGYTDGLQVVDVTDPANLQVVGASDTPDMARDVLAFNGHAYIADHSSFRAYDTANPNSPVLTETLHETTSDDIKKMGHGDQFITMMNGDGRLLIVDPAIPGEPELAGFYDIWGFA